MASSSSSVGSPNSLTQRHRPPPSSSKDSNIRVDIYDEVGIGGGLCGVSGGLLHPYSPKAKFLWRAADCWTESLNLLSAAEAAVASAAQNSDDQCQLLEEGFDDVDWISWGILRPALSMENLTLLKDVIPPIVLLAQQCTWVRPPVGQRSSKSS
ncbi:hypothetical protein ACFXTI_017261 [Malus domestica]